MASLRPRPPWARVSPLSACRNRSKRRGESHGSTRAGRPARAENWAVWFSRGSVGPLSRRSSLALAQLTHLEPRDHLVLRARHLGRGNGDVLPQCRLRAGPEDAVDGPGIVAGVRKRLLDLTHVFGRRAALRPGRGRSPTPSRRARMRPARAPTLPPRASRPRGRERGSRSRSAPNGSIARLVPPCCPSGASCVVPLPAPAAAAASPSRSSA